MSQARRCDACKAYYDDPSKLSSNVLDNRPASFTLGKDKLPFQVSISLLPYRMIGEKQQLPVDLCPACRYKCLMGVGELMVAGCRQELKNLRKRRGKAPSAPEPEKAGPEKQPERRESPCRPTK